MLTLNSNFPCFSPLQYPTPYCRDLYIYNVCRSLFSSDSEMGTFRVLGPSGVLESDKG